MTIRRYEPSDSVAVRSLIERTPMPDGTPPTAPDWPAELDDIASNFGAFWVALDDEGVVIGSVGVQDVSLHPATIPLPGLLDQTVSTARLRRLDVDPAHQRQGLGRRLSQAAVDWARDNGFTRVVLDTTTLQLPAIALYESMGFRQVAQARFQRWDLLWFELPLQ